MLATESCGAEQGEVSPGTGASTSSTAPVCPGLPGTLAPVPGMAGEDRRNSQEHCGGHWPWSRDRSSWGPGKIPAQGSPSPMSQTGGSPTSSSCHLASQILTPETEGGLSGGVTGLQLQNPGNVHCNCPSSCWAGKGPGERGRGREGKEKKGCWVEGWQGALWKDPIPAFPVGISASSSH